MRLPRFVTSGLAVAVITTIGFGLLSGCVKKEQQVVKKNVSANLVFYSLFDGEDVYQPLIQQYTAKHPSVTIKYRKFTDPVEYMNLIINELAEGRGPDIFSAPNYWFLRNVKKLSPLPAQTLSPQQFEQTFVSVANDDLVLKDPADSQSKVFGIPLSVDTLALYYNKNAFDDKIPAQGKPAATWEGLKDDVFKLTKTDNSFERFEVAGIAMGRSDNIARAVDILYLLMLQYKANFYNENYSKTEFANQQTATSAGFLINPAVEALKLYTSFALPSNKNYSWNQYLASADSPVKEVESFARGKVAMIFGYSYLYEQIKSTMKDLKDKGVQTLDSAAVRISTVPQVNDPAVSTDKRVAYANYYAQTVARTSEHPAEAWDFLMFMSSKDNLAFYNSKTHRSTSRRDMIEDQKKDPIYGVFAEQIGYAESIPTYDFDRYKDLFVQAITSVLATTTPENAIRSVANIIDDMLPSQGLVPAAAKVPAAGAGTKPTQQKAK